MAVVVYTAEDVERIVLSTIERYENHMSSHYDTNDRILAALRADSYNAANLKMTEAVGAANGEQKEKKTKSEITAVKKEQKTATGNENIVKLEGRVNEKKFKVEEKAQATIAKKSSNAKVERIDKVEGETKADKKKDQKTVTGKEKIIKLESRVNEKKGETNADKKSKTSAELKTPASKCIETPDDWEEILMSLNNQKDIAWKTLFGAAMIEQGEHMKQAVKLVGFNEDNFKKNFGLRACLLAELCVACGCPVIQFYRLFALINQILNIKEVDSNEQFMKNMLQYFNSATGNSDGRNERFQYLSNPLLMKGGSRNKSRFPYGTGTAVAEDGTKFLEKTSRPLFNR